MTYDRRLIEDSLPLEIISEQSAREKSIRQGHISTLHIWWARRPLAAMRAAIFASLIPAPKDEQEREHLHKLIGDIVSWDSVKNGNSASIEEARTLIRKHYPDAPPRILDPFMGGGSTGLEALRLGAEAHGVELNPVAYLIQLCTLVYPQKYGQPKTVYAAAEPEPAQIEIPGMEAPKKPEQMALAMSTGEPITIKNPLAADVRKWGMWVLEEARKEIGHLYEDPEAQTTVAYLWARTAKCPNPQCGAEMPMVRQWWLAKTARKKAAIRMNVDKVARRISFSVAEGADIDFEPDKGTMREGSIICPVCGQIPSETHLMDEGKAGRLGATMMAVVTEGTGNGKVYRSVLPSDYAKYDLAQHLLEQIFAEQPEWELIEPIDPTRPSPNARGLSAITRYGITEWGQMFNTRQMTSLITFASKIRTVKDVCEGDEGYISAIVTYLALIFDRMANQANTFSRWDNTRDNIQGVYARQAIGMIWDYAESNPFSGSTGDWLTALNWVQLVIEHTAKASAEPALLYRGDATRLPQSETLLDAVITDPPYYDSVPYADLSDFFYIWLKRNLSQIYPQLFVTPLTPKSPEIIEHARNGNEARQFYESQMTKALVKLIEY